MVADQIRELINQNELDKAIEILIQADNQEEILEMISWEGYLESACGNIKRSFEIFNKILYICEKLKNDPFFALCSTNIGFSYILKGELDLGFDYINRAFSMAENFDNSQIIGVIYNHLGVYYHLREDADKGLFYLEKAISLKDDILETLLAWLYYNAAKIYRMKNNIDKTVDYFKRSLNFFISSPNELGDEKSFGIACNLIRLIILNLDLGEIDKAKEYLSKFDILEDSNNKMVQVRKDLGTALILKMNPRAMYKFEAQKILSNIVNQEVVDNEFTIIAMVNLCDLLLDELQTYNQEEVFLELESLLNQLYTVSQDYKSHFFLVESLILKSKFALVKGKISEADELLKKANFFAREKNLNDSLARITEEQSNLSNSLKLWENLTRSGANISEKLKEIEIKEYMKHALNAVRQL
ncbi:MAG: tetratricopeptide repeat protein [Candidatus Hodarchaeales archaeon]